MTDKAKAVRGPGGKFLKKTEAQAPAPVEDPAAPAAPGFADGGFIWAMACVVAGQTAKRASWIGNKSISLDHPSRNILENEDFLANDWVLV